MTQTNSVSLGCPGCPKKSQHFFSPPNARADQRSARTRFAPGDTSCALNNPSVVRSTGALHGARTLPALTTSPSPAKVYIRTRSVHVSYTLFFGPISAPTPSISEASTEKPAISKKSNRTRFGPSCRLFYPRNKTYPHPLPILSILFIRSEFPASSPSHLRPIIKFATPCRRLNLHYLHSTQINFRTPELRF